MSGCKPFSSLTSRTPTKQRRLWQPRAIHHEEFAASPPPPEHLGLGESRITTRELRKKSVSCCRLKPAPRSTTSKRLPRVTESTEFSSGPAIYQRTSATLASQIIQRFSRSSKRRSDASVRAGSPLESS